MMMPCARCKKRPATVFISTISGSEKKNEGLCIKCARELKIPQIEQYMQSFGISDEELDRLDSYVDDIMDGEDFELGGSNTMPPFIQNLLNGKSDIFKNLDKQKMSDFIPNSDDTSENPDNDDMVEFKDNKSNKAKKPRVANPKKKEKK